ncbi:SAM hydrolase/SAM-dependent halogenase family protein [Desulfovibrio inopinatus]|uniref:SAM hydrolase/SAM-dependent halogenase family protein n=1 Tax=Desulfovibrio inopinatus TaxID=102109 RepID=UPI000408ADE8|nr:SAM-dependent chlorinase/fluorinase [Desulfovibrio inopinatus]
MDLCISLLTDFGYDDPYVGQLKGVLASLAPHARIYDLTHGVRPHNVLQGGFFLCASLMTAPEKTVFLAVVDPGVGSNRRIVAARVKDRFLLAPDNGLLSMVIDYHKVQELVLVTNMDSHLGYGKISATFHGRDVFAPLAAALANGTPLSELGQPVDPKELVHHPLASPALHYTQVAAAVIHVDRFGNVVLNVPENAGYIPIELFELLSPKKERGRIVQTYADLKEMELGFLAGSQGFMELAYDRNSAAAILNLDIGDTVLFTPRALG